MLENPIWPIVMPLAIVAMLILSVEIGHRYGTRRMRISPSEKRTDTGPMQGAMLGLLGLLLGFSFAGAAGRFIERQDLITREANAIGTAHRRADLLDKAHADELKASLVSYLTHRLEISQKLHFAISAKDLQTTAKDHDLIWAAACTGVENKPAALTVVITVVNEVLDLHDYRVAAGRKHLPDVILALLVLSSVLTLGVMGYASALGGHRHTLMVSAIAILVAAALWTTIDMDWPRIGLLRVSDQSLYDQLKSISKVGG